ncbi:MAG: hypothetical protein ACK479_03490, partial [Fluviicola sp.]
LSVIIRYYPLLSVIIRYYPLLSVIIRYYPLLSVIIRYYPLLSVIISRKYGIIIRYYPLLSVIISRKYGIIIRYYLPYIRDYYPLKTLRKKRKMILLIQKPYKTEKGEPKIHLFPNLKTQFTKPIREYSEFY